MGSKHSAILIVGSVCALAVLTARPAHAQAARDPCALLTQAQLSSTVGANLGGPKPIGKTGCHWSTPDEATQPTRVTVTLWDGQAFAAMKAPLGNIAKTPVSGIGDDAVFATVRDLTTLSVKKGDTAFVVRLYGVRDQARQQAVEKSIAADILARW